MLISGKTDLKIKTVTRDKEGPYIMIKGSSGFSDSSAGKESTCKAEEPSSIPGSGRSAGKWIGYPVQYSGLQNSMDCGVHGVAKSRTQLSNSHFTS